MHALLDPKGAPVVLAIDDRDGSNEFTTSVLTSFICKAQL